jgi:hypothetical protein
MRTYRDGYVNNQPSSDAFLSNRRRGTVVERGWLPAFLNPTFLSTLSRMENAGAKQVRGAIRNLHRVLDALRNAAELVRWASQ